MTAGAEYGASPRLRRWFGEGYRDIWTTPFAAPVLDLSKEGGGLEPVRQVGHLQTAGLALRGADGKSYTFRSLDKEPDRLLPAAWRHSWPAKLVRDATSATHPGAAVMLPVLAEAAGIPHTQPRLVVMPDDPLLGTFRATFANRVGTIEEYPTASDVPGRGFHGATEIISTVELWRRWLQGPENRIDSRAFLRARILDLFVENYDRRRGQWRWMRIPGHPAWEPLPEDPDMAFVRHNGLMAASLRGRQPRLLEFSDKFPSKLEGPTSNAAEVDRWLLADLDGSVFEQTARELQAAWTDDVIDRTAAQLPEEWQALDQGRLAHDLRARRADLVEYVLRFYRYLAADADVHLTDLDERVSIATGADHSTTVTVTASGASEAYYTRRFVPGETSDIRLYLHGGNDRVERSGGKGPIHVRIIANGGTKVVESDGVSTEVWVDRGDVTGTKVHRVRSWTNPDAIADAPWLEPRNYGSLTGWSPTAWYSPDLGVVVGARLTRTTYGFRTEPDATEHTLRGGWSFARASGKLEYDGIFRRPASELAFNLRTLASGIEQVNFFGQGDNTPRERRRSRYHVQQTLLTFAPAVSVGRSSRALLTIGPEVRYSDSGGRTGTILFEQAPYGVGQFGVLDVRVRLDADTRRFPKTSLTSVALGESAGDAEDQSPGRGVRMSASAYVAPAVWDAQETYSGLDGFLAGYVGGHRLQLAARVGGQRVFGKFPWFDAAFIGGPNDRGFHSQRFSGNASLYGNLEVRTFFGPPVFTSIFPVRFGVIGVVDTGRVWFDRESTNTWHPSYGGGVLMTPVGTGIVLRAVVAKGSEGALLYAGSGFRF